MQPARIVRKLPSPKLRPQLRQKVSPKLAPKVIKKVAPKVKEDEIDSADWWKVGDHDHPHRVVAIYKMVGKSKKKKRSKRKSKLSKKILDKDDEEDDDEVRVHPTSRVPRKPVSRKKTKAKAKKTGRSRLLGHLKNPDVKKILRQRIADRLKKKKSSVDKIEIVQKKPAKKVRHPNLISKLKAFREKYGVKSTLAKEEPKKTKPVVRSRKAVRSARASIRPRI